MIPFPLFLALRYLRPRRNFASVVTILSVLGVIFGVAIMEIVLAVMTGFGDMWREKVLSFKPHIVVQSDTGYIDDSEAVCKAIESASDEIVGVCPAIQTPVMASYGDAISPAVVIGMDNERAPMMAKLKEKTTAGKFDLSGDNCVIGSALAQSMGMIGPAEILIYSPMNIISPDSLYLPEETKVRGIFSIGMHDYDSTFILASIDKARDLIGKYDGAQSVQVEVKNPEAVTPVMAAIGKALAEQCPEGGFYVQSWQEADSVLFNALSTEKTMMFVLLVFITIVAVFCVTNTLIVITIQKTSEIGLMKSLGFSSRHLMWAFLLHSQIQCVVGVALGVLSGWLVLKNLQNIVVFLTRWDIEVFPPEIYQFSNIPWKILPQDLIITVLSVFVFCAIASIIPALRAARMDPVEALRQE